MLRRTNRAAVWVWALACLYLLLVFVDGALAQAPDPPQCPTEPAEYTGSDDVVNELRAARHDAWVACLRIEDLLVKQRADLQAVKEATEGVGTDLLPVLEAIESNTEPAAPGTSETVALSEPDRTLIADAYDGLHGSAWYLAGLIVACAAGYVFYRQMMPRA